MLSFVDFITKYLSTFFTNSNFVVILLLSISFLLEEVSTSLGCTNV